MGVYPGWACEEWLTESQRDGAVRLLANASSVRGCFLMRVAMMFACRRLIVPSLRACARSSFLLPRERERAGGGCIRCTQCTQFSHPVDARNLEVMPAACLLAQLAPVAVRHTG